MIPSSVPSALALSLLALAPTAQNVKLNGPLATGARGSIQPFPSFSPDGKWVVYEVDDDPDNEFELYASPVDGKVPGVRLRGEAGPYESTFAVGNAHVVFAVEEGLFSIPIDGSGPAVEIAPEGGVLKLVEERGRVLYTVASGSPPDVVLELFSTPLDGSASPVRLGGPLPGPYYFLEPQLSADRSQVVFEATPDDPAQVDLFVAPVDGSQPARALDLPLVDGGSVEFLAVTAADLVVYTADQEEDERYELFAVPLDGSQPPRKLNGPLAPGADVGQLVPILHGHVLYSYARLSPDGLLAAYTADEDGDGLAELHAVPVDGSRGPVALSTPAQGNVELQHFTADSARVLYLTDRRVGASIELFSVRADGSEAPRRLNAPLAAGAWGVLPIQLVPDGPRIAYLADQDEPLKFELFSVPADGSEPPVKLNLPLPAYADVYNDRNLIPGHWVVGEEVVYEADAERDDVYELYRVPLAGGASTKIAGGPVSDLIPAAPVGAFPRVFFRRDRRELFTVTTRSGSVPVDVHPLARETVGSVGAFELAASGERVVFTANTHERTSFELFSSATDERHARVQLAGQIWHGPVLSPDDSQVVFAAVEDDALRLFSASSDGSDAPVDLGLVNSAYFAADPGLLLTRDGLSVLFLGGGGLSTATKLQRVPLDGSAPPADLGSALPAILTPTAPLRLSRDGSRVAFLMTASERGSPRLGVAPVDGSGPAVQISLASQRVESDFELAPDGSAVVYRLVGTRTDLFVAPADASSAPRKLNPVLVSRGTVPRFAVDWTSGRALYLADQEEDERFELYSVPLDGSAPAQRLGPTLVAGGDVLDFALEPQGGSVILAADAFVDERAELLRVRVDGSRAAVRLLRRPQLVGSVTGFALTPDGARVVFGATHAGGVRELYSLPLRPPAAPATPGLIRLSRPLVPGGSAGAFRISADSSTVAFLAQRDADHHLTLMAVPAGGEEKAVELAGPFTGSGSVDLFQLGADGSRIVYRADQDEAGVSELFLARYHRP